MPLNQPRQGTEAMSNHQEIIDKFIAKLGNEDFLLPPKLVDCGLYGSLAAVRTAMRQNVFPSIKVSPHRILISRDGVIDHIRKNLSVSG